MSTIARATLARDTVSERVRNEAAAQPAKLANIQQRLPNTKENGPKLIDRAEIKNTTWKDTFKDIATVLGIVLFVAAVATCLILFGPIIFASIGQACVIAFMILALIFVLLIIKPQQEQLA